MNFNLHCPVQQNYEQITHREDSAKSLEQIEMQHKIHVEYSRKDSNLRQSATIEN